MRNLYKNYIIGKRDKLLRKIKINNLYINVLNESLNTESDTKNINRNKKVIQKLNKSNELAEKKAVALAQKTEKYKINEEFAIDENVVLDIRNLSIQFGGLKAVDDLSFKVKKGEIFGLIGPNGAGKTTVFNCITQFYKPNTGQIFFKDKNDCVHDMTKIKVHNVIKTGIVRTFQNVELIWELSVLDNLLVAGHTLYQSNIFDHIIHTKRLSIENYVLKEKAIDILKKLDLLQYRDFIPLGLPYGILKKIELARTLMVDPQLIILDEPAAGLNDTETYELSKVIQSISKDYKCTIFLVEHDMGLVMDICETICAISFGKMLAIGTPAQIQEDKLVQEAYLGS